MIRVIPTDSIYFKLNQISLKRDNSTTMLRKLQAETEKTTNGEFLIHLSKEESFALNDAELEKVFINHYLKMDLNLIYEFNIDTSFEHYEFDLNNLN